jgi:hypothetical protein
VDDFPGGEGTACFKRLRDLGFLITKKLDSPSKSYSNKLEFYIGVTDRSWFEFHWKINLKRLISGRLVVSVVLAQSQRADFSYSN